MRKISLVLLLALGLTTTFAQAQQTTTQTTAQQKSSNLKVAISGFVKDSESGDALMRATVQIMQPDSTKMVTGGVTNNIGGYTIKNVSPGTYVVKISYIGYHNFFRKVELKEGQTTHNVGTVMLIPSSVMLQTAVVTGTLQQVEVKEDTVIFNADAFKTPEGSVLEELIKKLPGAEVDSDGKITINGKTVTKILVKGKEFFNNDTEVAMKNLPAEYINKLKVYDKKSDLTRITGIDDGNEETVIDLDMKKGMDKGWFGNIDGSIGTKEMWSGRLMVNRFSDTDQVSAFGNINSNGGQRTSHSAGLNLALRFGEEHQPGALEIGGNVRYNGSKNDSWSKSSSQNFVTTTTQTFSNNFNKSIGHNHGVNGDFKIEWQIDSLSTILFRPNFSFSNNDSWSGGYSASFQKQDPYSYTYNGLPIDNPLDDEQFAALPDSIKTNRNTTGSSSDSNSKSVSGNILINHRFMKAGRNMSLRLNGNWSDSDGNNFNLSDVKYYQRDNDDFIYRYRVSPNKNTGFGAGLTYSEPLATGLTLQLNYSFSHSRSESDSRTYNMGELERIKQNLDNIRDTILNNIGYLPEDFTEVYDSTLSRYNDNINNNQDIELTLRLNNEHIQAQAGVTYQPQHQRLDYAYMGHDTIASRDYAKFTPNFRFRYRFTRQHQITLNYRGNLTQPSITNLFDWTDDSNPLRISTGNPDLKPSFSHNVSLDYNNYVVSRIQNWNARLNFTTTTDNISQRTEYIAETGGQRTRPENINGDWSVSGNFGFSTPLFSERLMLNTNSSASYNNRVSYIYQNRETMKNTVKNIGLGENLSLTYRQTYWDIQASGRINYTNSESELMPGTNQNTFNFSYGLSSTGNFESGFGFNTSINMSSRRGYSSEAMNTNELIWNAQISYRFLKGRRGTIRLQANDILHNRSEISRTITATSRSDRESNNVYSYYTIGFTYRFQLMGTAEARREIREARRMRESGGNMPTFDSMNLPGMRDGGNAGGGDSAPMGGM